MKKIILTTLLLCLPSSHNIFGQLTKVYNPWDVTKDSSLIAYPFLGGLNNPKPLLVDINGDNLIDLLIGDISGNVTYAENKGTLEIPQWEIVTEQFASLDVGTWFTLADIDADGDLDLFCDSKTAKVSYYQNNSIGNNFQFTLIDTTFGGFLAGNNNTPAFCDIDNDGDQDFFYGNTTGYLTFYENIGDSANPNFDLPRDTYDSVYAYPSGLLSSQELHGFSNIKFADIDNDNDYDLFWGDIFNLNMYLFINNGVPELSDLIWQTQDYLPNATSGFNHPTFADIDNDSDLDLIIGVVQNADIDNLILYRNTGDNVDALFALEQNNVIENIDLGSTTVPAFADMDFDHDLDIILGNVSGQLTYYENIGSRYAPEYLFITDTYGGIDVGFSSAPFVVDYDSDGDFDLLIGNQTGKIAYWRNDGDRANFLPTLVDEQLAGINRDQLVTPQMIDLNDDGLKDLVIGEWDFNNNANVLLYRNIGDISNPLFVLTNSSLITADFREFTIPYFYDYDNDSIPDLLLGLFKEGIKFYKNNSAPNTFPSQATLILQPDTLIGSSDGFRLTPRYIDIDFDNDVDLFIGEKNGGLNFYEYSGNCCQGARGNVDGSIDDIVDLADIIMLGDFLFAKNLQPNLPCEQEANVNGDAIIDIGDIVDLVAHIYGSHTLNFSCQ